MDAQPMSASGQRGGNHEQQDRRKGVALVPRLPGIRHLAQIFQQFGGGRARRGERNGRRG